MTDQDHEPESASRRTWIEAGVTVAVVITVTVALVIGLGRGDDDAAAPSTSTPATTTTIPGDRRLDLFGVEITIPDGALDPEANLHGDLRSMPTSHLRSFAPVSPFLSLSVEGGEQRGPIHLDFPIEDGAGGLGDETVLLVLLVDGDDVEVLDGTWDPTARRLRVEVDRIADLGVVTWDRARLDTAIDGGFARIGREPVTVPDCDGHGGEQPIESTGGMTWCLHDDGDERTLRGRNRTRHVVQVSWNGAHLLDTDDPSDIAATLAAVPGGTTPTSMLIGPDATMRLTVAGDHEATISTRYDGEAPRATWISIVADIVSELSRNLPGAEERQPGEVLDHLDPLCSGEARSIRDLFRTCFDPGRIRDLIGGRTEPYLATLLQPDVLGARLEGPLRLTEVDLERHGHSDLWIDRRRPSGGSWPLGDLADDDVLGRALERDEFGVAWSRCIDDLCLVGDGDRIRIYHHDQGTSDWYPAVEFATAIDDPAAYLQVLGVEDQIIASILDP